MEIMPIRWYKERMRTRIPLDAAAPGKRILLDYTARSPSLLGLHPRHFLRREDLHAVAEEIGRRAYPRSALAETLEDQNLRFGGGASALNNARRLKDGRSLAVVGGQQAGLFGGPLYTAYKALTIVKLAAELERDLERPVVPVFWIASDDHDLAEVDHVDLPDPDPDGKRGKGWTRIRLSPPSAHAREPVSDVLLGEGVRPALERVREALAGTAFLEETLGPLEEAYAPDASYSQAFGRWMQASLGDLGLVLADPSDRRMKRLLAPLFQREIREGSPVSRALLRRTALLEKAGYRAQVDAHEGLLTLFLHAPGRQSIAADGAGFVVRAIGRKYGMAELLELLEQSPERFSPNAAFRPLCQDSLFPTAATVLGPSEIAYHFQLADAYADFGIPQPILFPRASLTLVEPRAASLLRRTGADLADVLSWREKTGQALAARRIPAGIARILERGRAEETARWAALREEAGRLDPALGRTADVAAARVDRQYRFLQSKAAKAVRRREETLSDQAARLTALLCPRSSLQERVYPLLPYLCSRGPGVLDVIREAIETADPSHVGVEV